MGNYADQVLKEHFNFRNTQKNPKHLESEVFPWKGVSTGMSSVLAVIWDRSWHNQLDSSDLQGTELLIPVAHERIQQCHRPL